MTENKKPETFFQGEYWNIKARLVVQAYKEKVMDEYTLAKDLATDDFLATITDEEIEDMKLAYEKEQGVNFVDSGEYEPSRKMLRRIENFERYKDLHYENLLKGLGHEFSVIDTFAKKEYKCEDGNHIETALTIITNEYIEEFDNLKKEDKMKYLKDNFLFIRNNRYSK